MSPVTRTENIDQAIFYQNEDSKLRSILLRGVYMISFAVILWLFLMGYSYYTSPLHTRPHRVEYAQLRPAGSDGLVYGIVGSAMMVLMLLYSLRKRTGLLGRSIPAKYLLDFHIYLGVFGPLLIVLHSSLKVQGLVSVSFWSMIAVMLSGYFGRYLYLHLPRNIKGDELTLNEIKAMSMKLISELKNRFALSDEVINQIETISIMPSTEHFSPLQAVLILLRDDIMTFQIRRRLRSRLYAIEALPKFQVKKILDILYERVKLQRRIDMFSRIQEVFYYWHVIHRPFAIIMYIFMFIHIGIAVWTGYAWL